MLLCIVCLFITYCSSARSLEFTEEPSDAVVALGQPFLLNCVVKHTGTENVIVAWKHNTTWILLNNSPQRYQQLANNSFLVTSFQPEDSGQWKCAGILQGSNSKIYSSTANVQQAYIEDDFLSPPADRTKELGQNVYFTCISPASLPRPRVFWQKNGVDFSGDSIAETGLSDLYTSASISIKNLEYSDAGSYTCCAVNPLIPHVVKKSPPATLIVNPSQYTPHFLLEPFSFVAVPGQPARLDCIIKGNPIPVVYWLHNGQRVVNTINRYQMANDSLYFTSFNSNFTGEYVCNGTNPAGTVANSPVLLHVAYIEYVFKQQPQNKTATEGDLVILVCGPPESFPVAVSVGWYHEFTQITPSARVTIENSGNLKFSSVKKSDEGMYFCDVTNSVTGETRTSEYAYLTVNVPPTFLVTPVNKTVNPSETIVLQCQASGSPPPLLSWSKDGKPLDFDHVSVTSNNMVITIHSAVTNDTGVYTCKANNVAGSQSSSAYVKVNVPSTLTQGPSNATRIVGELVTFQCSYDGDPKPQVSWFFRNSHNASKRLHNSATYIVSGSELQVVNITKKLEGWFICEGENSAGKVNSSAYLKVHVPATVLQPPSNTTVNQSSTASFTCQGSGDPTPHVIWYRQGVLLLDGSKYQISSDTITIMHVMEIDEGEYTCNVTNGIGSETMKAYLTVQVPPRNVILTGPNIVKSGQLVTLTCTAYGLPLPSYRWLKDDSSIPALAVQSQNTLTIKNVSRIHSGTYKCSAFNFLGIAETSMNMTVQVLPGPPKLLPAVPKSSSSIYITWIPPEFDGDSAIIGYVIKWKDNFSLKHVAYVNRTVTSYLVGNLMPYTWYHFEVYASNGIGTGRRSQPVSNRTLEAAPSVPGEVSVTVYNSSSVKVTWRSPVPSNGIITYYEIVYNGVTITSLARHGTSLVIGQLMPYTTYNVTVRAATGHIKDALWGNFSTVQTVTTLEAGPSAAPENLTAINITKNSITIQWQPVPLEYTNGVIRGYYLYYQQDGGKQGSEVVNITTHSTTVYQITGLKPWTIYMFSITAYTVSLGPQSDIVLVNTSQDVPSLSPLNVTLVSPTSENILVTWLPPPPDSHNGIILGYRVAYGSLSGKTMLRINTTYSEQVELTNLQKYTEYWVNVQAFTIAGYGPISKNQTTRTLEDVPGEVIFDVRSSTDPLALTVTWNPPQEKNGIITNYTIHVMFLNITSDTNITLEGTTTALTYTFLNIVDNTTHHVHVRAWTKIGPGPYGLPKTYFVPPLVPPQPTVAPTNSSSPDQGRRTSSGFLQSDIEMVLVIGFASLMGLVFLIIVIYLILARRHRHRTGRDVADGNRSFRSDAELHGDGLGHVIDIRESKFSGKTRRNDYVDNNNFADDIPLIINTKSTNQQGTKKEEKPQGNGIERGKEPSTDNPSNKNESSPTKGGDKSPLVKLRTSILEGGSQESLYDDPYSNVDELGDEDLSQAVNLSKEYDTDEETDSAVKNFVNPMFGDADDVELPPPPDYADIKDVEVDNMPIYAKVDMNKKRKSRESSPAPPPDFQDQNDYPTGITNPVYGSSRLVIEDQKSAGNDMRTFTPPQSPASRSMDLGYDPKVVYDQITNF